MIYILDHYDSFVYNLSAYLQELGETVLVRRLDEASLEELRELQPKGILLSPGPGHPDDLTCSHRLLEEWQNRVPILGVCLGHQIIGHFYGAQVVHGNRPMHGKLSVVTHTNRGIFAGLPSSFPVTRYHSLVVSEESLPDCLEVTAKSDDGAVMGIAHSGGMVQGVQFHPEAVLTEQGHALLRNFLTFCNGRN